MEINEDHSMVRRKFNLHGGNQERTCAGDVMEAIHVCIGQRNCHEMHARQSGAIYSFEPSDGKGPQPLLKQDGSYFLLGCGSETQVS